MHPVRLYSPKSLNSELKEKNMMVVQITDATTYFKGHIPNAILVSPEEIMGTPGMGVGKLPSLDLINNLLSKIGYRGDKTIVAYDDEGGGWAGRFLWVLDCIGHSSLGYLNGGLVAWRAESLPIEKNQREVPISKVRAELSTQPIASVDDVKNAIEDPQHLIWDARSEEEFVGLDKRALRGGHIPSAFNLDWSMLRDSKNHYCLPANLEQILREKGMFSGKKIITYCQAHHRSGLSYLVGRLFQLDIKAYDGAWIEWANRTDTPVEI